MNAPTDWASAIAILAAGLVLGGVLLFFFSRKRSVQTLGSDDDLEFRDLEQKRDALIEQLRELDLDTKLTPDQREAERRRLELETAAVLRQIDGAEKAHPQAADGVVADEVPAGAPMNPAMKGFLWGAASFAVLFGIGWFVVQQANPREQGGSPTGGMMGQAPAQARQQNPVVAQLEAAVAADPNNLQLRNDLAQAYLETDNMMGVFEQTKFVLERSPNDSRAMTFQGLVRMAMGEGESATKMLEKATEIDPKNLDAWVARAWAAAQSNDMKQAEKMIAEAVKQSPENKTQLEEIFSQMKAHVAGGMTQPAAAQSGELPAGHPPVEGMAPGPGAMASGGPAPGMTRPAPPNDGRAIHVTLELSPSATAKSGVLYVMARQPGGGGPPVAVKRMQVNQFPITFDFGSADSMMGQPLPDRFRLEARLDSDGDAATKPPTDPSAVLNEVAPGAKVKLALK